MFNKRKIGLLLILIGFGIPVILFFFQVHPGVVYEKAVIKTFERKLTPEEAVTLKSKVNKVYADREFLSEEEVLLNMELARLFKDNFKIASWSIKTQESFLISFRKVVGVGVLFVFIGLGMLIISFFPKEARPKKQQRRES